VRPFKRKQQGWVEETKDKKKKLLLTELKDKSRESPQLQQTNNYRRMKNQNVVKRSHLELPHGFGKYRRVTDHETGAIDTKINGRCRKSR
jgi:hypothetical protein